MPTDRIRHRRHYKVTLADVFDAHDKALQVGGVEGVRDVGLIQSAIGRPYVGYYPALHCKSAALLESLANNHGFIDGNKRTALLVVVLFLSKSGARIQGDDRQTALETLILDVVNGETEIDAIKRWFKERIVRD